MFACTRQVRTAFNKCDFCRCFSLLSPPGTATFLDPTRQRRSDARRICQPDVRRYRFTDAARPLAVRRHRVDARRRGSDRQERADADQHQRVGDLHLRRDVRAWKHRVRQRSARQR